ncbi:LpxT activity modulator PmrR [Escherichia coli]
MKNRVYESLTTVFSVLVVSSFLISGLPRTYRSFFSHTQARVPEVSCRFCRNCP